MHKTPRNACCLKRERKARVQLVLTVNKSDGTQIGEGPSVWLDLKNIKEMYQRVDSATAHPWKNAHSSVIRTKTDRMRLSLFMGGGCSPAAASNFAETFNQTALASWV
jgi:hypothetical protein